MNYAKKLTLIALCILFLILDNTVVPFFSIGGNYGSLIFVFVLSYSFINDYKDAVIIGVFSGLLQDLYMFNGMGLNALTNMLLCILACKIGENIFKEKRLIPVIGTFVLCLLKGFAIFTILYVLKIKMDISSILISSVYSIVLSFFMYKRVYRLCEKPFMKKQWKF